jgi:hypothetical protein
LFRAAQVKGELFYVRNMRVDAAALAGAIQVVVDNVHAKLGSGLHSELDYTSGPAMGVTSSEPHPEFQIS